MYVHVFGMHVCSCNLCLIINTLAGRTMLTGNTQSRMLKTKSSSTPEFARWAPLFPSPLTLSCGSHRVRQTSINPQRRTCLRGQCPNNPQGKDRRDLVRRTVPLPRPHLERGRRERRPRSQQPMMHVLLVRGLSLISLISCRGGLSSNVGRISPVSPKCPHVTRETRVEM